MVAHKRAMLIGLCHRRSIANRAAREILAEALRWCDRRLNPTIYLISIEWLIHTIGNVLAISARYGYIVAAFFC